MYVENNSLKFVRISDFHGDTLKKIRSKNIKGSYLGKSYILTTSDRSQEEVYDMLREFVNSDEWIEAIKKFSIDNIEDYVTYHYQDEYEILGVGGFMSDECENVMETIVCAFNEGRLSEEDLSNWETLIDKTVKCHVMKTVLYELENEVKELKKQGYDVDVLKELFK